MDCASSIRSASLYVLAATNDASAFTDHDWGAAPPSSTRETPPSAPAARSRSSTCDCSPANDRGVGVGAGVAVAVGSGSGDGDSTGAGGPTTARPASGAAPP